MARGGNLTPRTWAKPRWGEPHGFTDLKVFLNIGKCLIVMTDFIVKGNRSATEILSRKSFN